MEKHFSAFCLSIKVGIKSEMIQILTMNVSGTNISIDGYFVNALFKGEPANIRSVYTDKGFMLFFLLNSDE